MAGEVGLGAEQSLTLRTPSCEYINYSLRFTSMSTHSESPNQKKEKTRIFSCLLLAGEVGLEPTTNGFGDRDSTIELFAFANVYFNIKLNSCQFLFLNIF